MDKVSPVMVRVPNGTDYTSVSNLYYYDFSKDEREKLAEGEASFKSTVSYNSSAKGWGGNNNLTFIRVVYDDIHIDIDSKTELNYYIPKIYTEENKYTYAKRGVYMVKPKLEGSSDFSSPYQNDYADIDLSEYCDNQTEDGVAPNENNTTFHSFYVKKNGNFINSGITSYAHAKSVIQASARSGNTKLTLFPKSSPNKVYVRFNPGGYGARFTEFATNSTLTVTCLDSVKFSATCSNPRKGINGFHCITSNNSKVEVKLDEGRTDSGTLKFDNVPDGTIVYLTPLTGDVSFQVMPHPLGKNLDKGFVMYVPDTETGGQVITGDPENPVMNIPDVFVGASYTILGQGNKSDYVAFWEDGSADTNGDGIYSQAELENYYGKNYQPGLVPEKFRGDAVEYKIQSCGAKKLYYQFRKADGEDAPPNLKIYGRATYTQKNIFGDYKPVTEDLDGLTVSSTGDSCATGPNPDIPGQSGFFSLFSKTFNTMDTFFVTASATRRDGSLLSLKTTAYPGTHKKLEFYVDSTLTIEPVKLEGYLKKSSIGRFDTYTYEWYVLDSMTAIKNDDTKYRITVKCGSKDKTRRPDEAILHFYSSDGEPLVKNVDGQDVSTDITSKIDSGTGGVVSFEFVPKDFNAPKNTYMTIQLKDQYGNLYPEQKTGYKMYESMGVETLRTSFIFGNLFPAIEIIGNIRGDAGHKWNGSLNEGKSDNVSAYKKNMSKAELERAIQDRQDLEDNTFVDEKTKKAALERIDEQIENKKVDTLTLSLGADIKEIEKKSLDGTSLDAISKKKQKADLELAKSYKEYDTEKASESDYRVQQAVEKASEMQREYEHAVDNKVSPQERTKEINSVIKVKIGYMYIVSFKYDTIAENWYFDRMTLTVRANGEFKKTWKIVLPVGVTVGICIVAGGTFNGTVGFKHLEKKQRYYIKSAEDKSVLQRDNDEINLVKLWINSDDIEFLGAINIVPYISFTASAEKLVFEVSVTLRLDFKVCITTESDVSSYGKVMFTGDITIKICKVPITWKYNSGEHTFFGKEDSVSNNLLNDALGEAGANERLNGSANRFMLPDTDYVNDRSGWKGDKVNNALDEDGDGVVEKLLQEQIYTESEVDIKKINDKGDYLGVFTDIDKDRDDVYNKSAVYWSLYSAEFGQWSKPQQVNDDNTFDTDVKIVDLGDRGLFVIWSSSDKPLTSDMKITDRFNKLEIKGAFFDKDSRKFVEENGKTRILNVTKDSSQEEYSDTSPSVIYNENSMIIYYTKSKYDISDEKSGEAVGDVVYPSSTFKVFRTYNFSGKTGTDGSFVDDYDKLKDKSIAEEIKNRVNDYEQYNNHFYGQVFVDSVPDVFVEEELNDEGMWTKEPKIYPGHTVTSTVKPSDESGSSKIIGEETEIKGSEVKSTLAPYIIDHDAISYNNTGIFAYIADYDNDLKTVDDREVFFQTYDFNTGVMSSPIIVTSNGVSDSSVRLSRQSYTDKDGKAHEATMLSWIQKDKITSLNISNIIDNLGEPRTIEIDGDKVEYHIVEKTEKAGYIPPTVIACETPDNDEQVSTTE